ncbi:MAG: hypothetical protein FWB72_05020 [Firmicutes bacterium]|nr:hypothetical protein [Bacillota bacterium]MCL2177284.1 hypothetical protein [Bacillota bacterium]
MIIFDDTLINIILIAAIVLPVVFIIFYLATAGHRDFISSASQIDKGMSKDRIMRIMKQAPKYKEWDGSNSVYIWEKTQSGGWSWSQGKVTRRLTVTFDSNNKAVEVLKTNLDKGTR